MIENLLHEKYLEERIQNRYLPPELLNEILKQFHNNFSYSILGESVNKLPIHSFEWGGGPIRILLWSQMHGNESTTTKALVDFMRFLNEASEADVLKNTFKLYIVPMLNPDGAKAYTRENAAGVDLNRDFLDLSQPESRALMNYYQNIQPHYCFNLHDQRTIFGVGDTGNPATISFLSPAADLERSMPPHRIKAIQVIVAMNEYLQNFIPNQVGRFDDSYNRNCSGDTFQTLGTPTILFEAGHFPEDYDRNITRKYVFYSFLKALHSIYENDIVNNKIEDYLNIPQNNPCFFDIVYRNVKIDYENSELISNFAVQFSEVFEDQNIRFEGAIVAVGDLDNKIGHVEYDCQGNLFTDGIGHFPIIGQIANFYIGKNNKYVNGLRIVDN
jgi:hypothetical protein